MTSTVKVVNIDANLDNQRLFQVKSTIDYYQTYEHKNREIDYVDAAILYIYKNLCTVSVKMLVDHVGVHRSYFSRIFREKTGISPQEYIILCRLSLAAYYLEYTDLRVKEVACEVGYPDQLQFSKIFKNHFGISPSKIKKGALIDENLKRS